MCRKCDVTASATPSGSNTTSVPSPRTPVRAKGILTIRYIAPPTRAKRLVASRALDPARVPGPRDRARRGPPAAHSGRVLPLLPRGPHASLAGWKLAESPVSRAAWGRSHRGRVVPRRAASPISTGGVTSKPPRHVLRSQVSCALGQPTASASSECGGDRLRLFASCRRSAHRQPLGSSQLGASRPG